MTIPKTFAIQDIQEANEFINHPVLGYRLKQISQELLLLDGEDASKVFSSDRIKLRSSMTLFAEVDCSEEKIFIKVLNKYFNGEADQKTLELINNNNRAIV